MSASPPCYVHAVTTAVPEHSLTCDESIELLQQACTTPRSARLMRRVTRLTGIERRHLAALDSQFSNGDSLYRPSSEQPSGPGMGARNALFEPAATKLVRDILGEIDPKALEEVQSFITCSCTHASAPGLERPVLTESPVPNSADRWNLGFMGCSAALAGMRMAHHMAARQAHTLIVACELSSLHFQYSEKLDQLTANVLFSDGAAAMLITPEPSAIRIVDARCASLPDRADQMIWFADDFGLRLDLAQEIPDTIGEHIGAEVDKFLEANGLSRDQIAHWLVHPGGPQVLDAVENALGLDEHALDTSRDVLKRFGNMSSPTIFFIMRELFEQKLDGPCVAMAFGPGLTIELILLDIRREGE